MLLCVQETSLPIRVEYADRSCPNFSILIQELLLKKAASVIIEYRAAVIHVYNSRNRDIIEKYLHNTTEYLVGLFVKRYCKGHKLTEDDREYITCFYSYSIVGIVSRWIGEGMPPYDKDLIKRFSESFDATIDTMINLCETNN